jgi:hypothetical protein
MSINLTFANDNKDVEEIKSAVDKVKLLNKAKEGPNNSINYDCQDCIKDTDISTAVALDKEEVSIDRVMFMKGKRDNRLVIKRDKNTPEKVTIKYKERYRSCKKYVTFKNPLSGDIGFQCMIPSSSYTEDSITIDFSDRKLEGDSEYIEIELVKLASDSKGFVNARFREQTGKRISSDRSGKFLFFGTKYNLK